MAIEIAVRSAGQWLLATTLLLGCHRSSAAAKLGRAIFDGQRPLHAKMAGHALELPQEAVRCSNCHRDPSAAALAATVDASDLSSQGFGAPVSRERLTHAIPRRGGPPSVYDSVKLCKLLRDGIDPAFVMIPQAMPRYIFTDEECEALWAYLTIS